MRFTLIFVFTITLSALFIAPASAQILNIERSRIDNDTVNYLTGKAGLSFSVFNRNAGKNNPNNYLQLTFTGDLNYISEKHSYLLLNYYNYLLVNYDSDEQRNTVASTGYSHFRVNLLRHKNLSYELFSQVQTDKARGLELRTLVGGGIRVAILKSKINTIYTGSGLMYEHEEWKNPEQDGVIVTKDLPKLTNYISSKMKVTESFGVDGILYYQVGYDDTDNIFRNRVSGDIALNFKVNNNFTFNTNFSCTYEDEPIVPVTKFVYAISNGLQVSF